MLRSRWLCGLLAVFVCVGCTRNNPTFEKTVPVRGTVVRGNGSPISGGLITFRNKEANKGNAWAMIGNDGRFELGTYGKDDGAMLGSYTVTVEAIVYDQNGNPRPNRSLSIPAKYTQEETSDLTVEVKGDGEQDMKLVLQ